MTTTQDTQTLDFKIFEGSNYQQMPELISAGLVPAGAAQIMRGCLEGKLSFDRYYDSGDAVIYHLDSGVKLVWDSQDLRTLDTESTLEGGVLVLPAGTWKSINGEEFSKDKIARYTGKTQSKDDAKGNPFWQWLARNDQDLLGEYADQIFGRVKQRYDRDEAMGVYVNNPSLGLVLRLWCLGGVGNYNDGDAFGGHLGSDDYVGGRLVGVAPEAHQKLEEAVRRA